MAASIWSDCWAFTDRRIETLTSYRMDSSQEKGEGFRVSKIALGGAAGAFVAVAGVGMLVRGVPSLRSDVGGRPRESAK